MKEVEKIEDHKRYILPILFLIAVYFIVVLKTAWLGDDAFIIFRTVDNFVHGLGLRWNVSERVQAYTCPLWTMSLSGIYLLTHEIFFTSMIFSLLISLSTVVILFIYFRGKPHAFIIGLVLLTSSKAFVDYSTSGLENPLTHLLLVLFFIIFIGSNTGNTFFFLSLIFGLAITNRLDTIILLTPALTFQLLFHFNVKKIYLLLAGTLPFFLWEIFSLYYYGFPFPNTAYAKLSTGICQAEITQQGIFYFLNSLKYDPITLLSIFVAIVIPFVFRQAKVACLSIGVFLYLIYIIKIGGDFMSGRFLTATFLISILLIIHSAKNISKEYFLFLVGMSLLIGVMPTKSPLRKAFQYGEEVANREGFDNGIADERQFYIIREGGLLQLFRAKEITNHGALYQGWKIQQKKEEQVEIAECIGRKGYYAGPCAHIIDIYALADPLLARLPSKYNFNWRPGHFGRTIPAGYIETVQTGINLIKDQHLAEYYKYLSLITRGDLNNRERLYVILKMNLGGYDHLIDYEFYRFGDAKKIDYSVIKKAVNAGSIGNNGDIKVDSEGMIVALKERCHKNNIEITATNNASLYVIPMDGNRELCKLAVKATESDRDNQSTRSLVVPMRICARGYDRLYVIPINNECKVGYIRIDDQKASQEAYWTNKKIIDLQSIDFQKSILLSEANNIIKEGTKWCDRSVIPMGNKGIKVIVDMSIQHRYIELCADHNDKYRLIFYQGTQKLHEIVINERQIPSCGMSIRIKELPKDILNQKIDFIEVIPLDGDGLYSLGHIRFLEKEFRSPVSGR